MPKTGTRSRKVVDGRSRLQEFKLQMTSSIQICTLVLILTISVNIRSRLKRQLVIIAPLWVKIVGKISVAVGDLKILRRIMSVFERIQLKNENWWL